MIDPKLQAELRAKYNPDGSDLRKMQLRMLDMLKYIDKICRENDIKYWLSSGTCLGAVRHGGFIPWDDDCDIEMLEEDYKKFEKVMRNQTNSQFILQTHHNDMSYFPRFGKLRDTRSYLREYGADRKHRYNGIYIDIFPMTKSSSKRIHLIGRYILYYSCFYIPKLYKGSLLTYTSQLLGQALIGFSSFILNSLQKIGNGRYLRHLSPNYFPKERISKDIFPLKRINFENNEFNVPGNYNDYLTRIYGNYGLPNLDNIIPSHSQHITELKFLNENLN